jgi:hypothetical protein
MAKKKTNINEQLNTDNNIEQTENSIKKPQAKKADKKTTKTTKTTTTTTSVTNTQKEKTDYTKLTDYIQAVFFAHGYANNDAIPWVYLVSQVKLFVRTYKIDYVQQLNILRYMTEIKNIDITKDETLGLVPWYKDETMRYIQKYITLKQTSQDFNLDDDKVVYINKKQDDNRKIRFKKINITFDD